MTNRQLFYQHVAQTSPAPLALDIERAEGIYLYDTSCKSYVDFISGIAVSNVGHRHPAVLAAIEQQLQRYMHVMVYGEFVQSPQVELAKALADTLANYPTPNQEVLDSVYFTNSGAEAVEGAMKLAKRYTNRTKIFSFTKAYHGSTQGALSLGEESFRRNFRPLLPEIYQLEREDFSMLKQIDSNTAAVIIEPIGGESGVQVTSPTYLLALRQRCSEVGALLIFDEIQSGFGRTGTFWAFEQYGVVPDVLLCAKGMGGGMPIGAFIASNALMRVFQENPVLGHITTFGGHPVSCAASLATLQIIQSEGLLSEVTKKAHLIASLLVHPRIKEVRFKGLMMAVAFTDFQEMKLVIDRALQLGLLTDWFLYCDNALRVAPPLTITESEIRVACQILLQAIEEA